MATPSKRVTARFFKAASGAIPVRDFLLGLSDEDRRIVGRDIATVEFGWPVGMPTCRPLGDGLYEVRSNISDKRITRVAFTISRGEIILLHAFIKKAQKTPKAELAVARARQREG